MSEQLAELVAERHGSVAVVRLLGEIDLSNARELEGAIHTAASGASAIVLDLAGLDYVDSAGVGMLQRLGRRANDEQRSLRVVAPEGSAALRVLELTALAAALRVDDTVERALRLLATGEPG
jgi:anti-anti-sigma factor